MKKRGNKVGGGVRAGERGEAGGYKVPGPLMY